MKDRESKSGFKVLRALLIALALGMGLVSAKYPETDLWAKGVGWTALIFAMCIFQHWNARQERWFWKALALSGVLHSLLLWIVLPRLKGVNFFVLFIPIILEYFVILIIFIKADPQYREDTSD